MMLLLNINQKSAFYFLHIENNTYSSMTIIALPIMSIYVLMSQIFIICLCFCTHYKFSYNAYMLTARLACNRFYTLRFEKISQCRLEQQHNTNSHNHTLFTFLEIKPSMQFAAMIFSYDFVDFIV